VCGAWVRALHGLGCPIELGEGFGALEAGGERGVVADAEHGGALLAADLLDEVHGARGVLGVEAGGGLVGEDELGAAGEGAGDGDALLLADAEAVGHGGLARDVEAVEQGGGAVAVLGLGDVAERHRGHDVLNCGEALEEVEGLDDHADVGAAEVVALGAAEFVDGAAGDADLARGGLEQAQDEVEEGALAHAGAALEEHLLPRVDGEGGNIDERFAGSGLTLRMPLGPARGVAEGEAADVEGGVCHDGLL